MCDHDFRFVDECNECCTNCGMVNLVLDPNIFSFNHPPPIARRAYSREDRFFRLLVNLEGQQQIPKEVMTNIPVSVTDSISKLGAFLKRNVELRAFRNKLPSIWYHLGHRWNNITDWEMRKARAVFRQVREKISYLVLLPYVLCEIERLDLLQFTKPISKNMFKKYGEFLKGSKLLKYLV